MEAARRSISIRGPSPALDEVALPWLVRGHEVKITLHSAQNMAEKPSFCCVVTPLREGSALQMIERALSFVLARVSTPFLGEI